MLCNSGNAVRHDRSKSGMKAASGVQSVAPIKKTEIWNHAMFSYFWGFVSKVADSFAVFS